jgi:hypothetical protein
MLIVWLRWKDVRRPREGALAARVPWRRMKCGWCPGGEEAFQMPWRRMKCGWCPGGEEAFQMTWHHDPDVMDEHFQAAIAGSLGKQQGKGAAGSPAEIAAQEERLAIIQTNKTRWQTRIDAIIAEDHETLAALGEHGLLDFDRHQLRAGEKKLSQEQFDEFWALPGIAESMGHLRYLGAEELYGTFDSGKWNHPRLLKNTCPYDSAVEEGHRMLCADANMLFLLQQQTDNVQATLSERDAANTILTMHRFASARMWDAARLVVVRHALFVGNVYDHVPPSPFLSDNVLDLTTACNYVDRLFLLSGASIGGFALIRKVTCDHEGCGLHSIPIMDPSDNTNIEFPRLNGFPTFQERLTRWFSLPRRRCRQVVGYVLISPGDGNHYFHSAIVTWPIITSIQL